MRPLIVNYLLAIELFLLTLFSPFSLTAEQLSSTTSVLIIGGGPAGLACAIEASSYGYDVTIVEKRNTYSRSQPILLTSQSLMILRNWGVNIPVMQKIGTNHEGELFGAASRIKHIENGLSKRCELCGVKRISGDFQGFSYGKSVCVKTADNEIEIPYDILIGADGFYSKTREALSIRMNVFGIAAGAYLAIPQFSESKYGLKFTGVIKDDSNILRIIRGFFITYIQLQTSTTASKELIKKMLENLGWTNEVDAIDEGYISELVENIPISLASATTFYDLEKNALLVGDAAFSVSFLRGDGLNTSLSASKIIGRFLEEYLCDQVKAFEHFHDSMKILSDETIKLSADFF